MLLEAALNGARDPAAHPALPVTPAALAAAAAESVAAGAGAIHFHVRGPNGRESLAADDVVQALGAVRAAVPRTPVGVSTGAWIVRDPARRLSLIGQWVALPDFASVNFHEEGAVELARLLRSRGVGIEAGLANRTPTRRCGRRHSSRRSSTGRASACRACCTGSTRPRGGSSPPRPPGATTPASGWRTR